MSIETTACEESAERTAGCRLRRNSVFAGHDHKMQRMRIRRYTIGGHDFQFRNSLPWAAFPQLQGSVLANATYAWLCDPLRNRVFGREDVLVVDDPVQRRKRIDVARIRPNRMSDVADDRQAAIVAVKPGLDAIGRGKDGREDVEAERQHGCSASSQDIVGIALLYAGLRRREPARRGVILVRHTLATIIANADMVSVRVWDDIDGRKIVVEPAIGIDSAQRRPCETSIGR